MGNKPGETPETSRQHMSETETDDEDLSAPLRKSINSAVQTKNTDGPTLEADGPTLEAGETTDDLEEITHDEYRTSVKRKRHSLSPKERAAVMREPIQGVPTLFILT